MKVPEPVCEECWIKENAQWEPHSMDDDGNILMKLKDIEVPHKYNLDTVELCSKCGKMTIAGIYSMPPRAGFNFGVETMQETEHEGDEGP